MTANKSRSTTIKSVFTCNLLMYFLALCLPMTEPRGAMLSSLDFNLSGKIYRYNKYIFFMFFTNTHLVLVGIRDLFSRLQLVERLTMLWIGDNFLLSLTSWSEIGNK